MCKNTDEPRGHYAKWNNSDRERKNSTWFHWYVEAKKVKYTEAKTRRVATKSREVQEMWRYWSKDTKMQLCRMSKSRDLMCSMITTVNNTEPWTFTERGFQMLSWQKR